MTLFLVHQILFDSSISTSSSATFRTAMVDSPKESEEFVDSETDIQHESISERLITFFILALKKVLMT